MKHIFTKIHQVSDIAHDNIWDFQSWVWKLFTGNFANTKLSIRQLSFNRWLPWNLSVSVARTLLFVVSTPAAILTTVVATSLSIIVDTVKVVSYLALSPFYAAYSFFKNIKNKLFPSPEIKSLQQVNNEEEKLDVRDVNSSQENSFQNWLTLLNYARYAPSPHNMQSWLFQIDSETEVTLMYDPERLLPDTNPEGSYMAVGFGILIETMSVACGLLAGPRKDIETIFPAEGIQLDATAKGPQRLCTLRIVDCPRQNNSDAKESDLYPQLILDRRTSRLQYNGQPVANDSLQKLSQVAEDYGHKMEWTNEKSEVDWYLDLNAEAMLDDMSHKRTRNEVGNWLRFSKADAVKKADGLAAYAMNAPAWQLWLLANVHWVLRIPGIHQLVRHSYKQTMKGTATVAWLSGSFDTFPEWIKAGRMMARWWLTMTKEGYYLHPFGSVITNPDAHKMMDDKFPNPQRTNPIWMLARLGKNKGDQLPPQAQRIPLEKMIIRGAGKLGLFSLTRPVSPAQATVNAQKPEELQKAQAGPRELSL